RKSSAIISYRQGRADIHRALRGGFLLWYFGLLEKMNGSLIAIVCHEIRRFFQTETAQGTASIHIPLPSRVLRLLAQFVRHSLSKLMRVVRIESQFIARDDVRCSVIFWFGGSSSASPTLTRLRNQSVV